MREPARIYWPRAWDEKFASGKARLIGGGILVVLLVAAGVLLVSGGLSLSGLLALLLVAWLLPVLGGTYWLSIGRRRRGWVGAQAVELRGGRSAVMLPFAWLPKWAYLYFALVGAAWTAAMPYLASLRPDDGSSMSGRFHAVAPFFPIFSALFLTIVLSRFVRKRGQLGVGLSPEGVYHWSWFGCCFYAWDWISAVHPSLRRGAFVVELQVAEPQGAAPDAEENVFARFDFFREQKQHIPAGFLAVNPAVPLYAIEFYRRHPELRHELGADKGIERICNGDLPDVTLEVYNNGRFLPTAGTASTGE